MKTVRCRRRGITGISGEGFLDGRQGQAEDGVLSQGQLIHG